METGAHAVMRPCCFAKGVNSTLSTSENTFIFKIRILVDEKVFFERRKEGLIILGFIYFTLICQARIEKLH